MNIKKYIASLLIVVSGLVPATMAFAYTTTDKADYSPGSTVTISGNNSDGAGYLSGETANISVTAPYGQVNGSTVIGQDGTFSWQYVLPSDSSAGGSYSYTVTGQTSGVVQIGTFTDAVPTITLNPTNGLAESSVAFSGAHFQNNDPVTIKFDNVSQTTTGTCTVSGNTFGPCSFTVPVAAAIGAHTVMAADTHAHSASATFTVNTPPTDTTKPVITGHTSPAANGAGWNKTDVVVSFTCADEVGGSGIATNTVAGTTLTSEGSGQSVTNTGTCTDNAGNVADPATVTGINIDKTAPTISAAITGGTTGANGWYTSDVTVHYTCADSLSTVGANCPADVVLNTEGTSVSSPALTVTDLADNVSAASNVVTVKIDKTGPSAVLAVTAGTPGTNGWYTSDVTVSTTGTDSVSSPVTCSPDQFQTTDTAGTVFTGSCTNDAGLTTPAAPLTVKLDKTAPVVTITKPAQNDQFLQNSSVNAAWTATDANLGSVTATTPNGSAIDTSVVGAFTFNVTATDLAGNTTSVTHNYTVFTYVFGGILAPVSLTSKEFKQTSTIPVKFQVFNSVTHLPVQGPSATLLVNGAPATASGGSNVGNTFRYDTSAQQYIYNLSTKSLHTGLNSLNIIFASNPPSNPLTTTITLK